MPLPATQVPVADARDARDGCGEGVTPPERQRYALDHSVVRIDADADADAGSGSGSGSGTGTGTARRGRRRICWAGPLSLRSMIEIVRLSRSGSGLGAVSRTLRGAIGRARLRAAGRCPARVPRS